MIRLAKYRDKWLSEKFNEVIGFYPREFYCLDNFSSFKVLYRNYLYSSIEEAYQASKFLDTAPEIAHQIQQSYSAHEAQKIALENQLHQPIDWDEMKISIMEGLLRLKLEQNPYVKQKLLETLDCPIVEDSPKDNYWGWGINRDGQNMLGNLWMKLREEMRKNHFMKLHAGLFNKINSGEKEVEYRLNDEDCQQVKVGDTITFAHMQDEAQLLKVLVTDLKKYKTLLEMYTASFDQYLSEYYINAQAVVDDTADYFKGIEEYGCIAIHLKKLP